MQVDSRADSDIVADRARRIEAREVFGRAADATRGVPFGAVLLPALSIAGAPVHADALTVVVAAVVAGAVAIAVGRLAAPSTLTSACGVLVVAACAWVLTQASYAALGAIVAPALGLGVGSASPLAGVASLSARIRSVRRVPGGRAVSMTMVGSGGAVLVGALVGAGAVLGARALADRDAAAVVTFGLVVVPVALAVLAGPMPMVRGLRSYLLAASALLAGGGTVAYAGATIPSAAWFGPLVSHGPRGSNLVALTFDDGPDPPYTLEIARILDEHGAKGTFFTVGNALEARPDVSRALIEDGQLLGNHSYRHDAVRWLDPWYGELESTQEAFARTLGECPAFFRPPHGTHTPFMSREASSRGMTVVTWDVSAGDWATDDADLVARRVLDNVRPGSIILLHDGLDGNIGADRGVVVRALPAILEGLRDRGLEPVTLDRLLGKPGYLERC